MTGLPTVRVYLGDGAGGWYDVSAHARLSSGLSGEVGRTDEFAETDAGEVRVTLEATDGRFALGSPQYNCFVDQPLRIQFSKGAANRTYQGRIEEWPMTWTSQMAAKVSVSLSAINVQARLSRKRFTSMVAEEVRLAGLTTYWPLNEPEGTVTFGQAMASTDVGLLTAAGAGTAVAAGAGEAAFDGAPLAVFAAGQFLTVQLPTALPAGILSAALSTTEWGKVVATTSPAVSVTVEVVESGPDAGKIRASTSDGVTLVSTTVVNNGAVHCVAVSRAVESPGTAVTRLWVDATSVATHSGSSTTLKPLTAATVSVGQDFSGTIGHVVFGPESAAPDLFPLHWAILTGRLGDAPALRLWRLSSYLGLPITIGGTEFSAPGLAGQSLVGQSPWDAISQVVEAEGGLIYIDGTLDRPVYLTWRLLVALAIGTPSVSIPAKYTDLQGFATGKAYLKNTATGARAGGATQTARNDASIAAYDEYDGSPSGELILTGDDEVLSRLQWTANRYSTPRPRIGQLKVDVLTAPNALVADLLALDPGDLIRITDLPPTAPWSSLDLIVEGWTETVTDDSWELELNTSPADLRRCWVIEHPTYGSPTTTPATF